MNRNRKRITVKFLWSNSIKSTSLVWLVYWKTSRGIGNTVGLQATLPRGEKCVNLLNYIAGLYGIFFVLNFSNFRIGYHGWLKFPSLSALCVLFSGHFPWYICSFPIPSSCPFYPLLLSFLLFLSLLISFIFSSVQNISPHDRISNIFAEKRNAFYQLKNRRGILNHLLPLLDFT